MKTLKTLSTLVFAAGILFTSCKNKDNTTPTTTTPASTDPSISWISNSSASTGWTSSDATVTVGSPLQIGYTATANATTGTKLDSIFLNITRTDVTPHISVVSTATTVVNSPASTATGSFAIAAGVITTAGVYNVTYKIHDKNAYTNSISFNVTVVPNIGTAGAGSATAGGSASATGSYINLENALIYTQSQATGTPSVVELVYNDGKLYSPKDNLETSATIKAGGQTTMLQKYTGSASFSGITALDVAASNPTATNASIAAGDIYFFSTNGKKGVFQVTSNSASTTSSDAVTIYIQIQQ